jgi:opacity protein-like surface antigen
MKLNGVVKGINYSIPMIGILLALTSAKGNTGTMGPEIMAPGKIYAGVFGGGGASTRIDIHQYGTAFYPEAAGGPLAVNAFGHSNSRSVGLVGGQVGYQWMEMPPTLFHVPWSFSPAAELEGYYLGKSSFRGHEVNNDTDRLDEHDFVVKYPMSAGIFLANAVLNFNPPQCRVHPYIAAGIGGAVISISRATAIQVAPAEPGINHYNSNSSDPEATFAAQGKAGLSFDLNQNFSLFAEYRGLYIAATNYSFGSTVYPGHPVTSNWRVELDSQYYNTGVVGLRCAI